MTETLEITTEQINDRPLLPGMVEDRGLRPMIAAQIRPHGGRARGGRPQGGGAGDAGAQRGAGSRLPADASERGDRRLDGGGAGAPRAVAGGARAARTGAIAPLAVLAEPQHGGDAWAGRVLVVRVVTLPAYRQRQGAARLARTDAPAPHDRTRHRRRPQQHRQRAARRPARPGPPAPVRPATQQRLAPAPACSGRPFGVPSPSTARPFTQMISYRLLNPALGSPDRPPAAQ
jgi:hypothetical protein